jgi:hypothetical protein
MILFPFSVSQLVGNLGVTGAAFSSIGTAIIVLTVSLVALWRKLGFQGGKIHQIGIKVWMLQENYLSSF